MKAFEVGKSYSPADGAFDPVTVIRRTAKCIVVRDRGGNTWRMIIRTNADGCEWVRDSSVEPRWRDAFIYRADWEAE